MVKSNEYIDTVTKIHNQAYLEKEYLSYIKSHENSKYIMIDFKKFKLVNDTFGHDVGDLCLKTFAELLENEFDDSIVARLHGDEYCIVTNLSDEDIVKRFKLVTLNIATSEAAKRIGRAFEYNAGVAPADSNLPLTAEKADRVMYVTKKKNDVVGFFNDEIWAEKLAEDKLALETEQSIQSHEISYVKRPFFDGEGSKTDLTEITSRSADGTSIITSENYELLKSKSIIKKLDLYNLEMMLNKLAKKTNGRLLINYDCNSLLAKPDLVEFFSIKLDTYKINPSKIIISINLNDVDPRQYDEAIKLISDLKQLGLGICLDKVSSRTPDCYVIDVNPNFMKYDPKYIEESKENVTSRDLLKVKMVYFASQGIKPIFTCVKDENDFVHIKNLTKNMPNENDILISGDHIGKEAKIM